jgi:hypothetical protein
VPLLTDEFWLRSDNAAGQVHIAWSFGHCISPVSLVNIAAWREFVLRQQTGRWSEGRPVTTKKSFTRFNII